MVVHVPDRGAQDSGPRSIDPVANDRVPHGVVGKGLQQCGGEGPGGTAQGEAGPRRGVGDDVPDEMVHDLGDELLAPGGRRRQGCEPGTRSPGAAPRPAGRTGRSRRTACGRAVPAIRQGRSGCATMHTSLLGLLRLPMVSRRQRPATTRATMSRSSGSTSCSRPAAEVRHGQPAQVVLLVPCATTSGRRSAAWWCSRRRRRCSHGRAPDPRWRRRDNRRLPRFDGLRTTSVTAEPG